MAIKKVLPSRHVESFGKELHARLFAVRAIVGRPIRTELAEPDIRQISNEWGAIY
jgi:hypothetical protein